ALTEFGFSVWIVGVGFACRPTMKGSVLDSPPPGAGLKTFTLAVPAAATSGARICAVSCVLLTNVVARSPPFHRTTALGAKFAPLTVSANPELPAIIESGLRLVSLGIGLFWSTVAAPLMI